MRRSLTSELPDHGIGQGHGGAARTNSRIHAARGGTFLAIPLFSAPTLDSPAPKARDSRSARARRRAVRVDLSLRSRSARPTVHLCSLLQASPAAHLRWPWQTSVHCGRELLRHIARHRGLKMLDQNERAASRFPARQTRGPQLESSMASRLAKPNLNPT